MDRGCTDVPWLLLYIVWWGAVWLVIGLALDEGGDIENLFTKVDYKGDRCGVSEAEVDNEVAMWLTADGDYTGLFLCIEACEDARTPLYQAINSSEFIGQCLPGLDAVEAALPEGNSQSMAAAMNDVRGTVGLIAAGAAVAIVASFLYTWFLSGFAGCLVWTAIFGTIAGTAFVAWTFFQTASDLEATGENPNQQQAAYAMSFILIVAMVIFICIIIFLRNRIRIAVQVVKEASAAISDIKSLVVFPTLPLVIGIGYFAFWIWGALLIFSVQVETTVEIAAEDRVDIQQNFIFQTNSSLTNIDLITDIDVGDFPGTPTFESYTEMEFDSEIQNPFAVYFFHLLWTVQFLIYLTFATVAGAVAEWYFSASDNDGNKVVGSERGQLSHTPVTGAFKRVLRYHLGTIFFGAFIIAIVQFVRAVVKYIEEKSKSKNNRLQRAMFCLIQCCLKCLESCLDQMSQNAFIWNAIYGDAFCPSAFSSFGLIWRNLARVAAINLVSQYLLVIGKVVVTLFCGGFVGLIITNAEPYKTDVSSAVFPVLITMFLAYLVASLFMVVYDTTIDTIFLCFLVDEEVNKEKGQMRARPSLVKLIDDHAVASKDAADKEKAGTTRGMQSSGIDLGSTRDVNAGQ